MQDSRPRTILDAIGNTPIVQLTRVVQPDMARVLVKVEGSNPTGSKKDRMAREVILAAERDGRLQPGQQVVEYSGGSTGTSLALVCAATGHHLTVVSSDAFSREKLDHMAALGATVTCVPSQDGRITETLIKALIARADEIVGATGAFWTDQLNNPDATRGYFPLGREIWDDSQGHVDVYVDSVGTAHGILGVAQALRHHNPRIEVVAVEPSESPVLSQGRTGAHRIEGIGLGFVVPAWDDSAVDAIETVSSEEAHAMARRLAAEEGLFGGASTGANIVVALRVAERLGPEKTVATVSPDSGIKYLSTEVYRKLSERQNAPL